MKSFEVRIYRFNPAEPQHLVGTLQEEHRDNQYTFNSMSELWEQLQTLQAKELGNMSQRVEFS